MGYYMGDFGGRMMGDPGFFSAIARLGKGILGLGGGGATKVITVPAGPMAGAVARVGQVVAPIAKRAGAIVGRHPVLTAAGGAAAVGAAGAIAGRMTAAGMPQRGFHISRKTGALVRNRRMRVTNPRALRRAIRRATGFARLARRVLHFTSPRAPRGRAIFKRKRHKKI